MPLGYELPEYLRPQGDPVQFYAEGLRLGASQASAAAEQARAEERQALALREEQRALVDQQMKAQEFALKQQQAARRYAAQDKYQTLIQGGMDPATALLHVAPDLGESLTGAAALYKQTRTPEMTPYQAAEIALRKAAAEGRDYGEIVSKDLGGGVRGFYRPGSPGVHIVNAQRTAGELTPKEKMETMKLKVSAIRGMAPTASEMGTEPSYQARTNELGNVLRELQGVPVPPTGTNAPTPRKFKLLSIDGKPLADVGTDQSEDLTALPDESTDEEA